MKYIEAKLRENVRQKLQEFECYGRMFMQDTHGQGTTEYAILVGVLVVIAMVAVTAFKGKIQELWDSIASAINAL